jgi:phasin
LQPKVTQELPLKGLSVMTAAKNPNTPKPTASSFSLPNYEMPKMEVPAAFRGIADKGVAQAKDTCEKAKAATEDATHLFQNTYTAAAKGATDYNLKVFEIARINTNAAFEYAQELLEVKSLSEFVELSSARARKQFDTMAAQTKELTTLAQKVSIETAEPIKTGLTGAFNKAS